MQIDSDQESQTDIKNSNTQQQINQSKLMQVEDESQPTIKNENQLKKSIPESKFMQIDTDSQGSEQSTQNYPNEEEQTSKTMQEDDHNESQEDNQDTNTQEDEKNGQINKSKMQRTKRSKVYTVFDQSKEDKNIQICKYCSSDVRCISTSNLWSHIKYCKEIDEDDRKSLGRSEKEQENENQDEENNTEALHLEKQKSGLEDLQNSKELFIEKNTQIFNKETLKKYGMSKQTFEEKIIKLKIILMVIKDVRPISIVENDGFKSLLKFIKPDFQVPSRRSLRDGIIELYNKLEQNIKQTISIQFDHWTSVIQQKFISITANYINQDYQMKYINLINVPCQGETGLEIAQDLKNTLENFNIIDQNQEEKDISDVQKIFIIGDGTNSNKNAVNNIFYALPEIICFLHTCNNGLKEINQEEYFTKLISKVRYVAKFFRKSYSKQDDLKEIYDKVTDKDSKIPFKTLKLDVETRFNTLFYLVESYINNHKAIKKYIQLKNDNELKDLQKNILDEDELKIIQDIMSSIFQPFQNIFKDLQQRNEPSLYKVLVNYLEIKDTILKQKDTDSVQINLLKQNISKAFISKFEKQYKQTRIYLCLAVFLNPYYRQFVKNKFPLDEKPMLNLLRDYIFDIYIKKNEYGDNIPEEPQQPQPQNIQKKPQNIYDKYCDDMNNNEEQETKYDINKQIQRQVTKEIKQYQSLKFDKSKYPKQYLLQFYKKNSELFPIITQIAMKIHSVQATSTEVERNFSDMGNLITKKRNRLEPDIIDSIMFIKLNLRFESISEFTLQEKFLRLKLKAKKQNHDQKNDEEQNENEKI